MITVLIADDQALVRGGLRMILDAQDDIRVVGEAGDGREAVALISRSRPDVVLMDIRMPGTDGLQALRQLDLEAADGPKVLMLTTFDLDEYVYEALRAGAAGFLLKTTPPAELVRAVRETAAGDALFSPAVLRRLVRTYVRRPPPTSGVPVVLAPLTERELEVLRLVACGRTNSEIAGELHLAEATVKTHLNRILSKLRVRDRVQLVILAYETGLVYPNGT